MGDAHGFISGQGSKAGTVGFEKGVSPTLRTGMIPSAFLEKELKKYQVRRLLPVECERLQGFPDDWTKIPWNGKNIEDCPDSPRYKAVGNSMGVNVMRWLGHRLQLADDLFFLKKP